MSSRSPSSPIAFGRRAERPLALAGLRPIDLTSARAEYGANAADEPIFVRKLHGEMAVAYAEPGEMQRRERNEFSEAEGSGLLLLLCGVFSGIVSGVGLTITVFALMGKL